MFGVPLRLMPRRLEWDPDDQRRGGSTPTAGRTAPGLAEWSADHGHDLAVVAGPGVRPPVAHACSGFAGSDADAVRVRPSVRVGSVEARPESISSWLPEVLSVRTAPAKPSSASRESPVSG
jgi:hypothetical protein